MNTQQIVKHIIDIEQDKFICTVFYIAEIWSKFLHSAKLILI